VTILPPPELQEALDQAAQREGTTPESFVLSLLSDVLLPSRGAVIPPGGSLADQLADVIGVIDSGDYVPGGARLSERMDEFGAGLLRRHREGYP
jgi:hypothetical protein